MTRNDSARAQKNKSRACRPPMCLPLPARDAVLEKVRNAVNGTRFGTSLSLLRRVMQPGEDARLLERFITGDATLRYGLSQGSVVNMWKEGLALSKRRTQQHYSEGRVMVDDFSEGDISRVFADLCFTRFVYEDLSNASDLGDVGNASDDADIVMQIIERKILGGTEGVDLVEMMRLFSMF